MSLHTPDRTPIRFDFVIANFGTGSAYNVGFTVHADDEDFKAHHVIMRGRGTTDTPFSIIEPGGRITSVFGSGPGLLGGDNTALKPFKVAKLANLVRSGTEQPSELQLRAGSDGRWVPITALPSTLGRV